MTQIRFPRIGVARRMRWAGFTVGVLALSAWGRVLANDYPKTSVPDSGDRITLKMAETVAAQIKGARVVAVVPNGSMRPIFETKAYLLVESTSYESLRVGDIVTFEDSAHKTVVVERVLEKRGDVVWGAVDRTGNPGSATALSTHEVSRVFAILYANGSSPSGSDRR